MYYEEKLLNLKQYFEYDPISQFDSLIKSVTCKNPDRSKWNIANLYSTKDYSDFRIKYNQLLQQFHPGNTNQFIVLLTESIRINWKNGFTSPGQLISGRYRMLNGYTRPHYYMGFLFNSLKKSYTMLYYVPPNTQYGEENTQYGEEVVFVNNLSSDEVSNEQNDHIKLLVLDCDIPVTRMIYNEYLNEGAIDPVDTDEAKAKKHKPIYDIPEEAFWISLGPKSKDPKKIPIEKGSEFGIKDGRYKGFSAQLLEKSVTKMGTYWECIIIKSDGCVQTRILESQLAT